jgi:hypothetical protein
MQCGLAGYGQFNLHRFPEMKMPFISEKDALDFGFATARAWVDERVGID